MELKNLGVRVTQTIAFMLGIAALCTQAHASPGYTYDLIYVDDQFPGQTLRRGNVLPLAINNAGTVVFVTVSGADFQYHVYVAERGLAPQLVIESADLGELIEIRGVIPVGINDNGIVAVPLRWTLVDENQNPIGQEDGYGLYDPDTGLVGEIRNIEGSSGRLNNQLQMAGRSNVFGDEFLITDGSTTATTAGGFPFTPSEVQVNNMGVIAAFAIGDDDVSRVVWATPPGELQSVELGDRFGLGANFTGGATVVPGINDRGWLSYVFSGSGGTNPNPRVLLISPTGNVSTIAQATGSDFIDFFQPRAVQIPGVGLNNNNRIPFVAQEANNVERLWVGDATGDPLRIIVDDNELIRFTNGQQYPFDALTNDVMNINPHSFNDTGEMAMNGFGQLLDSDGIQIASSINLLLVARPVAGSEPGNPLLPETEDALPDGGWRFRGRCWRATVQDILGSCDPFGGVSMPTPRQWIDPPIAVGYDYTIDEASIGEFESVLIPAPLSGGDSEFTVEVNGAPATLEVGTPLYFSTVTPDPVRTFRISGIDQVESLDPDDPAVFVTGLTFGTSTDEDVSYTMVPVVFDPADMDSDGTPDAYDEFPMDPTMSGDPDGDGLDSNSDDDDDGDGVLDGLDDYPGGRFSDARPGYWSFTFIEALARAGITAGCGNNNYCPEEPVTRAQMAVFLERGMRGSDYRPPAATGLLFNDIGTGDFAAAFIEQLFADGITRGCGGGNYCPSAQVTRDQMAVFLLRSKYGSGYSPPAPTGTFGDVSTNFWAAAWIEQLASDGITAGCGSGNYCPGAPVTRAQMAVFLTRIFGL